MTSSSSDNFSTQGAPSTPLAPGEAKEELQWAESRSRSGVRWQVYELIMAAGILGGTAFVYHAQREHLATWLWIVAPLALVLAAVLAWRRRAVGRLEARWARVTTIAAVALAVTSMMLLSPLVGNSVAWGLGLAALPALPPLVSAAWLGFR